MTRVRVEPDETVEVEEEITVVRVRRRYLTPRPVEASSGFVDALTDSASPLRRALAAYPRRLTGAK